MKSTVPLSPKEQQARAVYSRVFWPAFFGMVIASAMLGALFDNWRTQEFGGSRWFGSIIGSLSVFEMGLARSMAFRKVRAAGLWSEPEVTILSKSPVFLVAGERRSWNYPKSLSYIMIGGSLTVALLMGLVIVHDVNPALRFVGILITLLFVLCTVSGIYRLAHPILAIDDQGVATFRTPWRRRTALWEKVVTCELKKTTVLSVASLPSEPSLFFNLKDKFGTSLLMGGVSSDLGASTASEVEAEIRRRMVS